MEISLENPTNKSSELVKHSQEQTNQLILSSSADGVTEIIREKQLEFLAKQAQELQLGYQ